MSTSISSEAITDQQTDKIYLANKSSFVTEIFANNKYRSRENNQMDIWKQKRSIVKIIVILILYFTISAVFYEQEVLYDGGYQKRRKVIPW